MKLLRILKSKQKLKEFAGQISTLTWQELDKPKQRASPPVVEVLCDSVGTWVCASAGNILGTKTRKLFSI